MDERGWMRTGPRRRGCRWALCAAVVALTVAGAVEAGTLDQSYAPTLNNGGLVIMNTAFYAGQSFTVGLAGVLSRVELFVDSCSESNSSGIDVAIRAGSDDPRGPVLATGLIPNSAIVFTCGVGAGASAAFAGVDVGSARLQVAIGEIYTIWVTSRNLLDQYRWWGDRPGTYADGSAKSNSQTLDLDLGFKTYVVASVPTFACVGFEAPLDQGAVRVKKNRVLPHKATLVRADSSPVLGTDIQAPPVMQVLFTATGAVDAVDVSGNAETAGTATSGNQFVFADGEWAYNLQVKDYTVKGTYVTRLISGDSSEYQVSPECEATFVIN